ncbi:RNA polymerase sigma factor [Streptomyces sp. NPDC085529]|uniref:RNA polymerase sigma factor n=1 Tax=Streptomyces sp. NPDC085529 TaxID=3365729 RepID=UPI0037D82D4B
MADANSPRRDPGDVPTDLTPEALSQWNEVARSLDSYRRTVRSWVTPNHADDVLAKATEKFYKHLRRNGPVAENPRSYFYKVCRNAAADHLTGIKKLAEDFVGDSTLSLVDPNQGLYVAATDGMTLVEVSDQVRRGLKVLEATFSPHELTTWLLREAYGLDATAIAEHTGSTAGAVRQTLRRARGKLKDPTVKRRLFGYTLATD